MCSRIQCHSCGKPSWVGCGAHVEMVLRDVPRDQRCKCRDAASASAPSGLGLFSSLFGGPRR